MNEGLPLFLILHGDGAVSNIELFSKEWRLDLLLSRGYAVAYLQSSKPFCTNGYGWTGDYQQSRKDIDYRPQRYINHHDLYPRRGKEQAERNKPPGFLIFDHITALNTQYSL